MTDAQSQENEYRILVADDEPIVHQMMARIISSSGLPVRLAATASCAEDALAIAKSTCPDICFLDIQMEEMSGLELAANIEDALGYKPVIVYVTAHRRFEYAQEAVRVGAMDYLVKPISTKAVLEALTRAVSRLEALRLDRIEKERLKQQLDAIAPATVAAVGPADRARRAEIVRAMKEFVEQNYAKPIGLSDVGDYLNFSAGYVGSLFKSEVGMSFRAYLRRVRIARAKELMRDPRLNLTEIAQRVGYNDISYFSQSFLQEAGVRPSEYRGGGRNWPK